VDEGVCRVNVLDGYKEARESEREGGDGRFIMSDIGIRELPGVRGYGWLQSFHGGNSWI